MPKYQIILESDEILADDEFKEYVRLLKFPEDSTKWELLEARNLEGIREELYKRKEELKQHVARTNPLSHEIEETYESIKQLFKLD